MKIYSVHRRDGDASAPSTRPSRARRWLALAIFGEQDEIVLVKEGICWPAAIFTVLWSLWHRLWAFTICLVAIGAAIGTLIDSLELDPAVDVALVVSALVLVGFFANDARRRALARRRYQFVAVVLGQGADSAQMRFLAASQETGALNP